MRQRWPLVVLGVLLVTRGLGCAYRTPRVAAPAALPPIVVGEVPAGVTTGRETLSVNVRFVSGGTAYEGIGFGRKSGSAYAPARRRALAVAIDDALAHAEAVR